MSTPVPPVLDFSRAHPPGDEPKRTDCSYCGRGLQAEYYRLGDGMSCGVCAENAKTLLPNDTHQAFGGALLWGIPAAVLGMAAYAAFSILTGIQIGWIAVGVGWMVAKAMLHGSGGVRGRRYQWTAMLLTYAAVALAFIPMVVVAAAREKRADKPQAAVSQPATTPSGAATCGASPHAASEKADAAGERHGLVYFVGLVLGIGLISPFYVLVHSFGSGLIGLLILFWGMQMAWKMLAAPRVQVDGPFPLQVA